MGRQSSRKSPMQTSFYDPGEQRATRVKSLFAQIAAHYDLVNDIQSLGLHRRWKKRVADLARVAPGQRALDLCCGTGDIALALAAGGAAVAGLDFTNEMLVRAADRRDSPTSSNYQDRIWFVRGDGQMLPFPDNTFDAVTVGYGLRNLADWQCGIDEMRRVAKPG